MASVDEQSKPDAAPASNSCENSDMEEDEKLAVDQDDSVATREAEIKKTDLRKIGKGNKGYRKTQNLNLETGRFNQVLECLTCKK